MKHLFIISFIILLIILILVIVIKKNILYETFKSVINEIPLAFDEQRYTFPDACKPYMGCTWPNMSGNPVVFSDGNKISPDNIDDVWCELAWRDCHIYQDCVNGQCVPKTNLKPA